MTAFNWYSTKQLFIFKCVNYFILFYLSKQDINMTNFLIHQSFCLKNIKFCEKCMQPYNINQEKEHFKLNHDFSVCKCGERVENYNFESHQVCLFNLFLL